MECLCGRTRARHGRCTECARTPARRVKRYELAVRDVLESDESTRGFVWNQPVHGTRLRPDFAWYFQRACVLLEVDERLCVCLCARTSAMQRCSLTVGHNGT
jgi:hypothetical protein